MFAILFAGNVFAGMTLYLSPDLARIFNGRTEEVIGAYEDRIAQMRVEIDRLHSRGFAQAGDINLQLQDLAQQQEMLFEQHQLVRALVDKADALGIAAVDVTPAPAPAPDVAPLAALTGNPDVDATALSIEQMMGETQMAMHGIAQAATTRADGIATEMRKLGIPVSLPEETEDGIGGPLLPAVDELNGTPMLDDANAVMSALIRYKAARESLDAAPVHMPISGNFRQSSNFGNRQDPFTGSRAFHSGMDFAAPSGTVVTSAAAGVVTYVGTRSGYGMVVEVTHASGLVTRYAHLSGYLAKEGQAVNTGTPIAKVGSTGRSTGPHLHFEIRKADEAINPKAFLDAGKRLVALLG
ncbi:M23 family metallopeptidase [Devosia soli]|uniref:M23 family metallopeptidase n=1 Tax=Devosia soli TaxID=361041 RepID=UPI0013792DBC|nr:M23 family metallopeptidase [Devosia soli]